MDTHPALPCVWRRNCPYKAGQFTKLALEQGERRVQRAYSFVNPPGTPYHEFYLVGSPAVELGPSLGSLQVGDHLLVQSQATGFLTLDEIPRDGISGCSQPAPPSAPSSPCWLRDRSSTASSIWCWYTQGEKGKSSAISHLSPVLPSSMAGVFAMFPSSVVRPGRGRWQGASRQPSSMAACERGGAELLPELSQVMICGNPPW